MNTCIVSEYNCTYDEFLAEVERMRPDLGPFVSDWEIAKVNDHKSIMVMNVTDFEAMEAFMTSDEMKQWDKDHGCVDTVYSLEKVG